MEKWNYYTNNGWYENTSVVEKQNEVIIYSFFNRLDWLPSNAVVYKNYIIFEGDFNECWMYFDAIVKVKSIDE